VLLGNLPPRDVLAQGTPEDVRRGVAEVLGPIQDRRRVIVSCAVERRPTYRAKIWMLCTMQP